MMKSLTNKEQADIDLEIFNGYITGVIRTREVYGVGLSEAKELFWTRYKELRDERDSEFSESHAEYCSGILE